MEYICPEKNCVYDSDEVQCTCGAEEKPCIPDWEDVVFVADDFLKSRSEQLDEKLNQPGFTERSKKQALELLGKQRRTRKQKQKQYLLDIKTKIEDAAVPSFNRCYPMYFVDEEQKADGHSTPRVRPKRGSIRYEDIPATRCNELTQLNFEYNMQPIWADDLKTSLKKENPVVEEEKKILYERVSGKRVPILYHGTHSCGPRLESLTYLYAYETPHNHQRTEYLRASSLNGAKERLKYLYHDLDKGALNRLLGRVVLNKFAGQHGLRRTRSNAEDKDMATFINPKCGYGWIGKIDQAIDKTENTIKSHDGNENIVFKFRLGVVKNGRFIPKKQDWTKFNKKRATDIENAYNTRVRGGYQNATLDKNATIVWTRSANRGDIMNNNNEKIGEVRRETHNWDEYAQECVHPQLYCYPKLTGTPDNKKAALKDSFKKLHKLNTCVAERADEVQKMRGDPDEKKKRDHKEVLASYEYILERCRKDIERALEEDKERSLKQPSCDESKESNCLRLVPYIVRNNNNHRFKYLIKTCGSRTNLLADLPDENVHYNDTKWNSLWNSNLYLHDLGAIFSHNLGVDPAVGPEEIRRLLTGVSRGTVAIKKRGDDLYVTKLIGDMDIDFGI